VVPEKVEIVATKKKMTLKEWFDSTLPQGMTKTTYAEFLAGKSGGKIGKSTLLNMLKGQKLTGYAKSKVISDLTGGKVPLTEIVASE
jgi:putative ribosome biogenesis GTPase RsgA